MKKENRMIIAGLVLLALQILASFGMLMSGSFPGGIFNLIGFCIFVIIGSILLIVGYYRKYNMDDKNDKGNKDNKSENDKK